MLDQSLMLINADQQRSDFRNWSKIWLNIDHCRSLPINKSISDYSVDAVEEMYSLYCSCFILFRSPELTWFHNVIEFRSLAFISFQLIMSWTICSRSCEAVPSQLTTLFILLFMATELLKRCLAVAIFAYISADNFSLHILKIVTKTVHTITWLSDGLCHVYKCLSKKKI